MEVTSTNWKKVFSIIWAGQAFSLVGSQMVHFAVAWWLTQSTGSATVLATMAIFATVPQVVLGPFIGAMVDRWNRRLVMIVADAVVALFTLLLAVLFITGHVQIWYLYVISLIRGTLGVFHWTAMQASTSLMVPHEHLSRVAGMNQTLQGVLSIAAPPLGALVVGLLPMGQVMMIDVVTASIAILPLLFVRIPQPDNVASDAVTPKALLQDVRQGLSYVLAWPGLVIVLLMATLINFLLNPTGILMPLLVKDHFHGGVWHLSVMESAWGVGIIAGGLLLSIWGGFKRRIVTTLSGLVVLGGAVLMTGMAPGNMFFMAVGGNSLAGLLNPLINGPLFAILQARIKPEMQGRVFTLVGSVAGAIAPIGMALSAPVADHLGIQTWWMIGGLVCLLMGVAGFLIPAVMHIEEDSSPDAAADPTSAAALPAD
jgi:MFS transporter, DHA3 family, macrolide efflux protein